MKKITGISLLLSTLLFSNMFTITDKKGNVLQEKKISATNNESIQQNPIEFSMQALYNELHKDENLAKKARYAQEKYLALKKKKKEAKKRGSTYRLTKLDQDALINYAKYFKGGKYIWGGTTPKGFDCSGYVQYLYKKQNINLPRTAWSQSKKGMSVAKNSLVKGDLLFFLTDKKRGIPVTHVGIYIGNGKFIHAASKKKGIIISPVHTGYYKNKFVSAKRIS